ncbi:YfcE family phosphodiesterase [Adlercreutzia sp. ZJ304]|uniref:YfcE family phosphodiesterase n=1 Tax=Adlercreutzia sp. ZJ304 TaxID=2709791 RepID=UPI0013ED49C1|nr:YfcE family phosphodiesterase [Adlercreutzia sp. ZJ304]
MAKKRIGIVSDTHGKLPEEVFDLFNGNWSSEKLTESAVQCYEVSYQEDGTVVLDDARAKNVIDTCACNLILHAGDIGAQSTLDELGAIARNIAVLGNNDYAIFWCSDGEVPVFRSFTFCGLDIAMMHIPSDLRTALHGEYPTVEPAVRKMPDLAVYGHTHIPEVKMDGNTLVVCPGSPTQSRRGGGHNVALIDIDDNHLRCVYIICLP